MVEIRNLKFQPLTLHLANSKRSVHMPPRGRTEINDNDVSTEIRRAAERGFVALREVRPAATPPKAPAPAPPRPAPAKTEQPRPSRPAADSTSRGRKPGADGAEPRGDHEG